MCARKPESIETRLLEAVREKTGLPALAAYGRLHEEGVCLIHFCGAVEHLSSRGRIRSADPERPIRPGMLPSRVLELHFDDASLPPRERPANGAVRRLGDFDVRLDQPLGNGSCGTVYRGEHVRLRRPAAIKIFRLRKIPSGVPRASFIERFRREPRFLATLNHPHIVHVFDCGEERDELWYAMELLEGGTLADRIETERILAPRELTVYFRAVAEALREAARHGILHRDVKPGNIFNEGIKLADFGLAKMVVPPPNGNAMPEITRGAALIGTLPYVAPERANFQPGDLRSEIYSLGATMYHAATGRFLFDLPHDDRVRWAKQHLYGQPVPIHHLLPTFPKGLEAIVDRCLAKAPDERYPHFDALLEALDGL